MEKMYEEYDYKKTLIIAMKWNCMIKIISTQKLWKGADKYHVGRYIGAGKDVMYPGYSFYARHSDIVMKGVKMLLNGAYRKMFVCNTQFSGQNRHKTFSRNRNHGHSPRNKEIEEQNPHKKDHRWKFSEYVSHFPQKIRNMEYLNRQIINNKLP